jgi:hypothetical protein
MGYDVWSAGLPLAIAAALSGGRPAQPREYQVDTARSRLWVVTHRSGLLSFLGHEHAIVPREWSAELCLSDSSGGGASGSIVILTRSLVIDSDSARSLAGLGGGPGGDDVREIQGKLLDAEHLDAEGHPEIRLDLIALEPATEAGVMRARVSLALRGTTRTYELPVQVEKLKDQTLQLTGELHVRQRDFGIRPESVAGVVKVADQVDLHVRLLAIPTARPCRPRAPHP